MTTTTLFKVIQSELIKKGHSEFESETPPTDIFPFGKFSFFDKNYQFTERILNFEKDVKDIVEYFFHGYSLEVKEHDTHFKKMFLMRFVNRQINRQTLESFKFELINVFLANQKYINRVYQDSEKFILQQTIGNTDNTQDNKGKSNTISQTDNREAFADLPQDYVNLDVNNTTMQVASDNTISRNKQTSNSENEANTTGNTKALNQSYSLDELIKSSKLLENIMKTFDRKCFLQIW